MKQGWQAVIGLEIHIQLNTKTKLFSSAPNTFGSEPNHNITTVCTGQPGSLPLLNKEAVKKAIQFGLAISASVEDSSFDRKSYFYPDSPKGYQTTQFFHPIVRGGSVTITIEGKEKVLSIQSAHLEDDAGISHHFSVPSSDSEEDRQFTGIDDNRAGAPLLEIVSDPCMHSPREAVLYAKEIRSIFQYIGASNANMEQGQMRIDANISVRPEGEQTLRGKIEIKNMNSFHFLEMAITAEINRQISIYEKDPKAVIPSFTCRFDPVKKELTVMREKESAGDYRYMPEPDIPPVIIDKALVDALYKNLPELPRERKKRYQETLGLAEDVTDFFINDKPLSDYFEKALAVCPFPSTLCHWIQTEFSGKLKELGKTVVSSGIPPEHIGELVCLIKNKTITARMGKEIAEEMLRSPKKNPQNIVKESSLYQPIRDEKALEPLIQSTLEENPQSIIDFKKGRTKAFAFLVGQIMKTTKGKADPGLVTKLLHKKLDSKG